MTSAADDLEALFDQVAAQRVETVSPSSLLVPPAESQPADADVMQATPPSQEAQETVDNNAAGTDAGSPEANSKHAIDLSDKPMYERLGGIVRLLHDSLRELGYDRSLSSVAIQINDAQGRLEYISTLTEQAATKVLNTIDIGLPQQETLAKDARLMEERWTELFEGRLGIEEFKTLAGDSKTFARKVAESTETEKARLLDIMMAQDFQDITGQLIKKIVIITHTVESELAQLLRDNAPPEAKAALEAAEAAKPVELMQGPSVPSAAMAQNDVDSLLADLGF
jgi:chemotaxis protein CheZ